MGFERLRISVCGLLMWTESQMSFINKLYEHYENMRRDEYFFCFPSLFS